MMNSFNLTLSGKHFICPSILNDSFAAYLFFNPNLKIYLLILEREEGIERERETLKWERNINQLPPILTPMGD